MRGAYDTIFVLKKSMDVWSNMIDLHIPLPSNVHIDLRIESTKSTFGLTGGQDKLIPVEMLCTLK